MNKNQSWRPVGIAPLFFLMCAASGLAQAPSTAPTQTPQATSGAAHPKKEPANDFAGLEFTDDQKAEIESIRKDIMSRKETVAKDEKLSGDQKDAMLLGYTRMEYGMIYNVLSPEQKRQVSQRIRARKAADQASQKMQPPAK
jgi:Spy/CpxP family protein refolding chaperone